MATGTGWLLLVLTRFLAKQLDPSASLEAHKVLDEDLRETRDMDSAAAGQLEKFLQGTAMPALKDVAKWRQRCCDAPERTQRKFQQVRKEARPQLRVDSCRAHRSDALERHRIEFRVL